jgi:hypothetical protein
MLWRYDSYGAQDHSAAELRGDTPFARLAKEAVRFMDLSNGANRCNLLMKRVTDTIIFVPED